MTTQMLRPSDCGPVAIANYLEASGFSTKQARDIYDIIMARGFPGSDGVKADLWDSPPRHFDMVESLVGVRPGLVDDPIMQPCVVLIRVGIWTWHWITVLFANGEGKITWHDGVKMQVVPFSERFPGAKVVLAYALVSSKPLPWYWGVWDRITRLIVGG